MYFNYRKSLSEITTYPLKGPLNIQTSVGVIQAMPYCDFYGNAMIKRCWIPPGSIQRLNTSIGNLYVLDDVLFYSNGNLMDAGEIASCNSNLPDCSNVFSNEYCVCEPMFYYFYPNEKMKGIYTYDSVYVNTPVGKLFANCYILYENGNLKMVDLQEDAIILGNNYSINDSVGWDENGNFLGEVKYDFDTDEMTVLE